MPDNCEYLLNNLIVPNSPSNFSVEANKRAIHNYFQAKKQTITYQTEATGPQHEPTWKSMPYGELVRSLTVLLNDLTESLVVNGVALLDQAVTGKRVKDAEEEAARQLCIKYGIPVV